VYGQEAIIPRDSVAQIMCIIALIELTNSSAVEKRLSELVDLEEDRFVVGFHKQAQKACEKAWHDVDIKHKKFQT